MKFWRRFVGATVLLLSTIALVSCLVGLAGIWMLQQTVYEKVQKVVACCGKLSRDRTIEEYTAEIWKAMTCPVP